MAPGSALLAQRPCGRRSWINHLAERLASGLFILAFRNADAVQMRAIVGSVAANGARGRTRSGGRPLGPAGGRTMTGDATTLRRAFCFGFHDDHIERGGLLPLPAA